MKIAQFQNEPTMVRYYLFVANKERMDGDEIYEEARKIQTQVKIPPKDEFLAADSTEHG